MTIPPSAGFQHPDTSAWLSLSAVSVVMARMPPGSSTVSASEPSLTPMSPQPPPSPSLVASGTPTMASTAAVKSLNAVILPKLP
jgi:hypothetical protein